jgi:dipeptidyl aminopeptidase/acylaminoacyl peptidase
MNRVWMAGILGALAACRPSSGTSGHAGVGGLGTAVAQMKATDLRLTPDGKVALYLADPRRPALQGLPPQLVLGELYEVPTSGGAPRKLGNGITNAPGGYLTSPDSRWALFLAGYNAAVQAGQLERVDLTDPSADPVELGSDVTYMLVSPDSKWLAFVSRGVLKVGPAGAAAFREVAGEVENAHFSPDGKQLLFKRTLAAAGSLLVQSVGGSEPARKVGDQVGDYLISPDSRRVAFAARSEVVHSTYDLFQAALPALKPERIAIGVGSFRYSSDGKWLARIEGQRPEVLGDLYVGPADGSAGRKLGQRVGEFEFAKDSTAIALLENYDVRPAPAGGSGAFSVAQLPDGKPQRIGDHVPNFVWGSDGKSLAFLARFYKPVYSDDLMLYAMGEEKAVKVHAGVYGYGFTPHNTALLFRSDCRRNGRECNLYRLDMAKPRDAAQQIVDAINTWKISEDGGRLLVTYARSDADAYDVAVYSLKTAQRQTLDQYIVPPAYFASPDGSRVVYVEKNGDRVGVYVADRVP